MQRFEFTTRRTWSNIPGVSPSTTGDDFPVQVKLPNGEVVDVDTGKQYDSHIPTRNGYYEQEGGVRTKFTRWGDSPSKSFGTSGSCLTLQVPKGSELIFE